MKNLETLQDIIPFYQHDFIQGFKSLSVYQQVFCGSTYHSSDVRLETLNDFRNTWESLHKQFGTSYTLKIHIMLEHVNTFVEQIEGGLNKRGSDQVTEAAHQLLHRRMTVSNYFVRKVGTEAEGRKLFRAVVHTNAYNI